MGKILTLLALSTLFTFLTPSLSYACDQNTICRNDRVNYDSYAGTVLEVFSNGNVRIRFDKHPHLENMYKHVSELGKAYRCIEELCVTDRVNAGRYAGTIMEVFTNGMVKVSIDGFRDTGYSFYKAKELGYAINCSIEDGAPNCFCRN